VNCRGGSTLTCARAAAFPIGVLATSGCVLFAAGCGRSPTAPDGGGITIRAAVTDRLGHPLTGALIDVLDGPLAGTTKLTDYAGKFELTVGATGTVTLRASREGFQPRTQAVFSQPPNIGVGFLIVLDSLEPPIGLAPGDYTLTVAIDLATASDHRSSPQAPCSGFPVDLAARSYRATIVEASNPLVLYNRWVSADDPTLLYHNLLDLSVAGRFVGFEWDAGLIEEFPGFRYLNILGTAPTTEPAIAAGSSVSIPFSGGFWYCQTKSARVGYNNCSQVPADQIVEHHMCESDHATMVFTKR
jgi:hypothetical protein